MILSNDFREWFGLLNAHSVRYLVVGGYAVAFHGHPRYTKDIDVWVDATQANAGRLLDALDAFGFGSLGLELDDFVLPDRVVQLGRPPNRIDLLTSVSGVEFDEAWADRITSESDGVPIHFINVDALRRNKLATGRLQDLADLEALE